MSAEAIFAEALAKNTPTERAAYLDEVCGQDTALRNRVETLLRSHESAGSFLGKPAIQFAAEELAGKTMGERTKAEHPEEDVNAEALGFLSPSDKPDSLGRLGHYEILEVIGRGGMGIVLRAFDAKLHRIVAIKVMAPELAATSPPRKRFLREARSAAAVRHEHVVDIHAVEEQPIPYLVMEYVSGETLQQKHERVGPFDVPEVLRLGQQIARGLAAAHERGLIHRDIKPSNILLEKGAQERVKITDFGLARAVADASLTQSGVIAGTPMYMAPEQTVGDAIDHRADLFSLGSVLYTMCSGRPPFRATTSMATLKRVAEDPPRPIREIIPEVPPWLCDIIAKLHAKKPDERFQSAKEVAELLRQHLTHLENPTLAPMPVPVVVAPQKAAVGEEPAPHPILPSPFPGEGPSVRRPRRRRWPVAAAILLALLGGLSLTEATGVTQLRATVLRIFTPDGTLVVETDDPNVKITVEGDGDLVITGAGAQEVRLRPGSYKLRATKDGKPVPLDQELVTITSGDKQVVRVTVETKGLAEPVRPTFVTPWSDSDSWVVKGQELLQPDNSGCYRLFFGDPSWTDYDFEGEFEVIAGGNEIIFAFRATGPRTHLYATIGANGERCDRHGILAQFNEKSGAVVLAGVTGPTTPKGRWYRVRVEARGNGFKLFLDGKLLTSANHEGYPRGCVGLVTNPSNARFRNLKVTDPGGTVLFEGVQGILPKAKGARTPASGGVP